MKVTVPDLIKLYGLMFHDMIRIPVVTINDPNNDIKIAHLLSVFELYVSFVRQSNRNAKIVYQIRIKRVMKIIHAQYR